MHMGHRPISLNVQTRDLPVEPLIQCEAGRAKTIQRQSLYSPRTPKWPPSDKGEFAAGDHLVQKPPLWRANCGLSHRKQSNFIYILFVLDDAVFNLLSSVAVFVPCGCIWSN